MSEIVQLWLSQLWKLLVIWPAWLLTPEGRRAILTRKMLSRLGTAAAVVVTLMLLAKGLPVDPAFVLTGDLIAYLDVIAIALMSGAVGFLARVARAAGRAVRSLIHTSARQGRPAARRRARRIRSPANDDDAEAAPLYGRLRAA